MADELLLVIVDLTLKSSASEKEVRLLLAQNASASLREEPGCDGDPLHGALLVDGAAEAEDRGRVHDLVRGGQEAADQVGSAQNRVVVDRRDVDDARLFRLHRLDPQP